MASTASAAINGPKPRCVSATADTRPAAAALPSRASTEVERTAGRCSGRTSSLKMVSRSGNTPSWAATHADRFTTNTSSRSGRTITRDSRAARPASTSTETAAVREVRCSAARTVVAGVEPASRTAYAATVRTPTRPSQASGHQRPSTSTKASTAAPARARTTGVAGMRPAEPWPPTAAQPPVDRVRRTARAMVATTHRPNAGSRVTPTRRARWKTTVQMASAPTTRSSTRSDRRAMRSPASTCTINPPPGPPPRPGPHDGRGW